MSRKRRPMIDTSRLVRLKPDDIPPDLAAAGWRCKAPNYAIRVGLDGKTTAWVRADGMDYDAAGQRVLVWSGGAHCPERRLPDAVIFSGVDAMHAVEDAEADGPLSARWYGQRGAPQFADWLHRVRRGHDVWCRQAPDGRAIIVFQMHPMHGSRRVQYAVGVGGTVVSRDGTPDLFDWPADAIAAAEARMYSNHMAADKRVLTFQPE